MHERVIVELLRVLIEKRTVNPPGNESELTAFIREWLTEAGSDVIVDEVVPGRSNVVATLSGNGDHPTVLLNAHVDVVPPGRGWSVDPFSGEEHDGRVWGRGAADTKGGLAAMMLAMKALAQVSDRGPVVLAAVVDEEGLQLGSRRLIEMMASPNFVIVAEPTALVPTIAQRGQVFFEIVASGRAAHSSVPETGVNAITAMCRIVLALEAAWQGMPESSHPLLGGPTINVGVIQGGEIAASVPDECRASFDFRFLPGQEPDHLVQTIRAIVDSVAGPAVHTEIVTSAILSAYEIGGTNRLAVLAREVTSRVCGRDPGFGGLSGTCDASIFSAAGIETIILGPGRLAQAHGPDEYVAIEEVSQAFEIYLQLVLALGRQA